MERSKVNDPNDVTDNLNHRACSAVLEAFCQKMGIAPPSVFVASPSNISEEEQEQERNNINIVSTGQVQASLAAGEHDHEQLCRVFRSQEELSSSAPSLSTNNSSNETQHQASTLALGPSIFDQLDSLSFGSTAQATPTKRVSYGTVNVQSFERCLGQSVVPGGKTFSFPLGMEMQAMNGGTTVSVNNYEAQKQERLRQRWKQYQKEQLGDLFEQDPPGELERWGTVFCSTVQAKLRKQLLFPPPNEAETSSLTLDSAPSPSSLGEHDPPRMITRHSIRVHVSRTVHHI